MTAGSPHPTTPSRAGWFRRLYGIGWWNFSGLSAAAAAGAAELQKRGMNRLIFDSPKYGVTVVVAKGDRAKDLHEWWEAARG